VEKRKNLKSIIDLGKKGKFSVEKRKNLKSIIENIRILKFKKVCKRSSAFFSVKKYFNEVIKPLYGDQIYALKQIGKSIDRKCELFYENDEEVGMLVYKTLLTNEYAEMGIEKALEIKLQKEEQKRFLLHLLLENRK
jgi:hypothetical protein